MEDIAQYQRFGNAEKEELVRSAFTNNGFNVSDYEIARLCRGFVTSRFVGTVRKRIAREQAAAGIQPITQRVVKRGNSTYVMQVEKIGKRARKKETKREKIKIDKRVANILKNDFGREI